MALAALIGTNLYAVSGRQQSYDWLRCDGKANKGRLILLKRKYQFFVSSTYEDLKEERDIAIHAILTMNQFPVGMEMFSAADDDQWQIIKEAIDSSDYYILIIGNRYGSIEETTGVSYTEK